MTGQRTRHSGPAIPQEVPPLRLRHHRHRRSISGHGYFKRLGPGIVTGAADDDPSGIGTYSQVGAAYGYGILWSALLVAPMAVAVQEMAARLGLVTGTGLGTLIRNRFPRWVLLGCVALVAIANTFNIAADLASMGASAHLVVPLPPALLTVAMASAMLALEIFRSYHRYARILRFLALALLARSRRTLGEHRSGPLSTTVVVLTIIASTALPIAYLVS